RNILSISHTNVNNLSTLSSSLLQHLQKQESACSGEQCVYYCALCDYSTKACLNLVQHARSPRHQQNEGLRKLQLHQQGLGGEEDGLNLHQLYHVKDCPQQQGNGLVVFWGPKQKQTTVIHPSDQAERNNHSASIKPSRTKQPFSSIRPSSTKQPFSIHQTKQKETTQCPYCNYRSKDANRIQLHVVSQHSMQQPVICCPLCQDVLSNKIHLQLHLTHLHSVAPDCVDKLLMTVAGPDVMVPNSMMYPSPGQDNALSLMEASATLSETSGKPTEELKPPKEGSEAPDWKTSGGVEQDRKSPDSLQDHLNDLQRRQQQQLSVSDRHIYKYRCNHCSLAFKTMQKLQIHSQYHAIRAATMCSLCQRSFRTFLALRKHLENGHPELSKAEVQQLCGSLPVNGDFVPESEARAYEEAQQAFEQEMDKDDELDLEEKASSTGSDSSLLLDDMGAETKRTLPFRKGPNFTMEKFLDPSRPYKCTVCKESFTQKNILLVHYNSVSHLHKLKKVLQEASSPVSPETNNNADNKPFKCNICNVAYSQSSTLEIHMRSVLHHTKVRTARTETSSNSSTGIGNTSGMAPSSIPVPTGQGNNANSETARSVTPLVNKENTVDAKEANNSNNAKHTTDYVSAQQSHQNAQSQAQLQMQLQHELQQQAAFFQPQFLNPAFYPQFGMTPEALSIITSSMV
uniref:C2H2-type domain-containing protein n=1 Tax=Oncorhynchus kisutch TaxID=8019 RepID=A0A8C7KNT0_ONCKI